MPKSKKSDSEKPSKLKAPKASKESKSGKEKKGKKKDKTLESVVTETIARPVKALKKAAAAAQEAVTEIAISVEDISLRAYYIAERRIAMGWPGDSTSDWVEAERQLKAEAKRKKK